MFTILDNAGWNVDINRNFQGLFTRSPLCAIVNSRTGWIQTMTAANTSIVFVTPCHNEEGRVGKVVTALRSAFPGAEVVVVDDCSSDSSADEARGCGATVLSHLCNLGYGAALQTGYMYATQAGYEILVQLDSDGQHAIESINDLIAPVRDGSFDMAVGSRHMAVDPAHMPPIRRLGQKIFAATIRAFGGPKMSDPTSGFQAMNSRALRLFADDVFPCDYPDSDVILMAHYAGLRITEVPVKMLPRVGGTSLHSGLKPLYYGIKMFFSMIIVFLNRKQWKVLGQALSGLSNPPGKEETTHAA